MWGMEMHGAVLHSAVSCVIISSKGAALLQHKREAPEDIIE